MSRRPIPLALVLGLAAACNTPDLPSADLAAGADLTASADDLAGPADLAPPADLAAAPSACLTETSGDLAQVVMNAPFAGRNGPAQMTIVPVGSPRWLAGRRAALAWAAADCAAFRAAATDMGYRASLLRDTVSGTRHWVLVDDSQLYNGVFVFRAPEELAAARPLVVDAPHLGYDFTDDRAVRVYRELGAVALLQNTAHRCNLADLSGCSNVVNYACGAGGVRASDAVHATAHLYYAVYDGLEQARDDMHLEYHGAAATANAAGCAGTAHISQASNKKLSAQADDGTFPSRAWQALTARLGDACVCYHQRESGCLLDGAASTAGRRTNQEAPLMMSTGDVCTASPPGLAARFVHMEQYNVAVTDVIAALKAAL